MPANPVKTYVIFRDDSTYKTYELKKTDYEALCDAIMEEKNAVRVSIGVIVLSGIREVVEWKAPEPVTPVREYAPAVPTDMMTPAELDYVLQMLAPFYERSAEDMGKEGEVS